MPALNNHRELGAETSPVFRMLALDVVVLLGMALLFMGAVASSLAKVNLIPVKDPGLKECLRFENQ
jgi:hypothetical protein